MSQAGITCCGARQRWAQVNPPDPTTDVYIILGLCLCTFRLSVPVVSTTTLGTSRQDPATSAWYSHKMGYENHVRREYATILDNTLLFRASLGSTSCPFCGMKTGTCLMSHVNEREHDRGAWWKRACYEKRVELVFAPKVQLEYRLFTLC